MTKALISADELHDLLHGPEAGQVLIVDLRWDLQGFHPDRYEQGHLPGAALCSLTPAFNDPEGGEGRHPLPSPETVRQHLSAWGVNESTLVVVYDDAPMIRPSVRAWWCLTWAGHARTCALDGGLSAWVAAGYPVQTGRGRVLASVEGFASVQGDSAAADFRTVSSEEVLAHVTASDTSLALFDVRAPERFSGANEPIDPVAGHIPGATNLPQSTLFDEEGRFLPPADVAAAIAPTLAADERGDTVVAYCGSGVTATHLVLARHVLGLPTALYAPSWSGWVSNPARPVARAQ